VKIDTYRMGEITARLRDRVEELETRAHELAGEEFMLGSTQQVARILFEVLGLTAGRKGKTGYSTDSRVLRSIRGEHEIVQVNRGMARVLKALEHVSRSFARADLAGRRPPSHDLQPGRRLHRPALDDESEPAGDPHSHRARARDQKRLVTEPGHRLVSADYSQVELRILAQVSGEPKLREAFAQGEDIHAATACEVLGKERAELTKDERNVAKMVNFGIIYGISAFGLSENLEIPRNRPRSTSTRTSRASRSSRTSSSGRSSSCTATATRRRLFGAAARSGAQGVEPPDPLPGERLAVNFVMQGTAADIIKARWSRSTGGCARRGGPRGSCSRCTTSSSSRPGRRDLGDQGHPAGEMCGAYPLDPPLAVDVGVGDDWNEAKS
jgi:DNA polymerase-1